MRRLPELPESSTTPASDRDVITAGILSLALGGFLLWAAWWIFSDTRSIKDLLSFPALALMSITALPGFAFVIIAFYLFRPKQMRKSQLMGSAVLYFMSGILIFPSITTLVLTFLEPSKFTDINNQELNQALYLFIGLGILAFQLARMKSLKKRRSATENQSPR